jgi:pimeloyl-ACP methyl ester carboxylesterase
MLSPGGWRPPGLTDSPMRPRPSRPGRGARVQPGSDLPKIDAPILVIQGDDDNVLPYPKTGQRLPGMVRDLQVDVIEAGLHGIAWTHADQVNSALPKFMA